MSYAADMRIALAQQLRGGPEIERECEHCGEAHLCATPPAVIAEEEAQMLLELA